jgi:hypothetical protein
LKTKEKKTESWNKTEGIIIKSELGSLKMTGETEYESNFRANIEYSYEINKEKLTSDQAFFGDKLYKSGKRKYKKLLAKFPLNSKVIVYYNPQDFSESVLLKRMGNQRIVNIFIGFGLVFVGALMEKYSEAITKFVEQL